MKIKFLLCSLILLNVQLLGQPVNGFILNKEITKPAATFEENKGQVKDQNWKSRPDVLFYGHQEGMNYFIKNNGVSYQFSKVDSWRIEDEFHVKTGGKKNKVPKQYSTYRVDANWVDYNSEFTVEQGAALVGYNNFYNVPDGVEQALFVKQYESVKLKNVWQGIDIHYYGSLGSLEADYIVSPGADYKQIKIRIEGADLSTTSNGLLIMKTPFGEIREGELKVYQGEALLQATWKIEECNLVSIVIPNYNPMLAIRIDPITKAWDVNYGGSLADNATCTTTDVFGNVFLAGGTLSTSTISSGGHQNTYGGGSSVAGDAYLVKFNSLGVRQWGTYYGGSDADIGYSSASDASGNIFLSGTTSSTSAIASGGHQNTFGGGEDAFLVKFNFSGVRQWATYYGGIGSDYGFSTSCDFAGNVFLGGYTNSTPLGISSGGYQNLYGGGSADAFLVKFSNNGVRQWGTYYGGLDSDIAFSTATDAVGNVYIAGNTKSTSGISFLGHQNTFGGGTNVDAFLVKFNGYGVLQWGTYYGSNTIDYGFSVSTDGQSNVYLAGTTLSSNSIAFGGYQNTKGWSYDAYLVKFNSNGVRQWGTYYGGSGTGSDYGSSTITDTSGNVYLAGSTENISSIASGGYQNVFGGGNSDAFLVKFNSNGLRQWGTYYGGIEDEMVSINRPSIPTTTDVVGNVFLAGDVSGGTGNAYLVKFPIPVIAIQPSDTTKACSNSSVSIGLTSSLTGMGYQWKMKSPSATQYTNINASGTNLFSGYQTNTLTIGNPSALNGYSFICVVLSAFNTETSNPSVLILYTIPSASITADGLNNNPVSINMGDATALVLNGSFNSVNPNFIWTPAAGLSSNSIFNPIAFPTSSTNYTATFTNNFGCTQSVSKQINVTSLPNNGAISVISGSGLSGFSVFDSLKVQVKLVGVSNVYSAYARLRYTGPLAPYLTYVGYTAGTILGSGSSVISTPPIAAGTYGYDFGISKIGSVAGYSGTGTLYTFYFRPNSVPSNLLGSQVCFFVDNLSITNSTTGTQVGLINQGPSCFTFSNQANVWPGDLDNNKTVNTADLLKIGVFYNNTGTVRPNSSLQWIAQPATMWGTNTIGPNGDAFKAFVDGNGDGIINNADQTSVGFNMGKVHALAQPIDSVSVNRIATTGDLVLVPTPGYISASAQSQQLELSVSLANAGSTLSNLYGISFDIAVDTNVFDLQNTTFDYSGSIFGIPSQNFLKIEYVANGVVSVGMTRFNNPSINGNGLLCKIRLNTYAGLNYSGTNLTFNGTVTAANDIIGMPYAIGPASVQIPYGSSASLSEISDDNSQVILYPNPAGETLNLVINEEVFVKEIKVLDETGRVVIIKTPNSMITKYAIETLNLAEGIYTIQLVTKDGQIYKKFVKGD